MERNRILVLVVKSIERDAFLQAVQAVNGAVPVARRYGEHTVVHLGQLGGTEILLAQSGEQGMGSPTGMTLAANSIIAGCKPAYVILTGICYGLKEHDQSLGDVVVSERVINVDHREVRDNGVLERGTNSAPAGILLDRFQVSTLAWREPPKIHFGPMLASSILLNSHDEREKLKTRHPKAVGGDMEGAAVFAAAAKNKTDWIVVKGISDLGMQKGENFEPLIAAANAARFVVATLQAADLHDPVHLVHNTANGVTRSGGQMRHRNLTFLASVALMAGLLATALAFASPFWQGMTDARVGSPDSEASSPSETALFKKLAVNLDLSNMSDPPQMGWNADTQEAVVIDGDFTIECRHKVDDNKKGCVRGEPAVYHLLPASPLGVTAVQAPTDPTNEKSVCARLKPSPNFVRIRHGGAYCVFTETKVLGVLITNLPPGDPQARVGLTITAWPRQ